MQWEQKDRPFPALRGVIIKVWAQPVGLRDNRGLHCEQEGIHQCNTRFSFCAGVSDYSLVLTLRVNCTATN